MQIPIGYTKLAVGDTIKAGDKFVSVDFLPRNIADINAWDDVRTSIGTEYNVGVTQYALDSDKFVVIRCNDFKSAVDKLVTELKKVYIAEGYTNVSVTVNAAITTPQSVQHKY